MDIYSADSVHSTESRENQKNIPSSKILPQVGLDLSDLIFPALNATPVLVHVSLRCLNPYNPRINRVKLNDLLNV